MKKSAFSLIELSIVLLIIGIILAGITQASRIYTAYRLSSARTISQSSAVPSISELAMWYDATNEASFDYFEAEDGEYISNWYDVNPQSTDKHNSTQSTKSVKPIYTTNCINDLPCARFAGGDFVQFDGTFLVNKHYTIFVVEQKAAAGNDWFIGGLNPGAANRKLVFGYNTNTTLDFSHSNNGSRATVPAFTVVQPIIHSFVFNSTTGRDYYYNGSSKSLTSTGSSPDETAFLEYYASAYIGKSGSTNYHYDGDIGEIIMYTKTLNTEERQAVEQYLAKKWGATITSS